MNPRRYELTHFEWSIIQPCCRTSRAVCLGRTTAAC